MNSSRRIYLYKMVCDNGGAPCVQYGLLSLAICKPQIRNCAKKDDLVLGFIGKTMARKGDIPPDSALVYAARVTETVPGKRYYDGSDIYSKRCDSIYRWDGRQFIWIDNHYHDAKSIDHDLGKDRDRSRVLLSNDFRYFGDMAKRWEAFKLVIDCVDKMTRGHRVNHDDRLFRELDRLEAELWRVPAPVQAKPIQAPDVSSAEEDDEGTCEVHCGH